MRAIYLKELSSYFKSARGYICLGLYFLFGGQFLLMQISYKGTNDIAAVFADMYIVVLLTLPLLTMRLLSEEKRTRTDQALFTAPVSLTEIVWGKFLAAFTVFALGISIFIVYFLVLGALSKPDFSMFLGNFLGMLLLGSALISIGLLISALTESQMLAAVGTFACMIFVIFLDSVGGILPDSLSMVSGALAVISLEARFSDFVSGILDPANVIYFISIVLIFNFLSERVLDKNRWMANKRMKNAAFSAVITVVFVAVIVLGNVVLSILLKHVPSVDLTDKQLYRLSRESVEAVKQINTDVDITVCYDQEKLCDTDYGKQMDELLKEYSRKNDRIRVRFADVLKEPEIVSEYAEYGVAEGSIIIESGQRTKVLTLNDCVEAIPDENGRSYIYESTAEQQLTSGILYTTEQSVLQVSMLTGHQEQGCADISNYLQENNYQVVEQNIGTEEISVDSEIAFLLAPMTDYSAAELAKLDRFLDNDGKFGKKLFYVAAYNQPELPALAGFLEEWGIRVGNSLIVETEASNKYDENGFMFGAGFAEAADVYLQQVKNPSLPFIGYYCRPVEVLWEENDNRSADYLIASPETSVCYELAGGQVLADQNAEKQSYGLAALGTRLKYEGTEERTSQVAVFGSASMFSSSSAVSDSFNNRDFTVELINTLAGKQNGVSIEGVRFTAQQLTVTQATYQTIAVLLGILLPLVTFAAGAVMSVYRRRL